MYHVSTYSIYHLDKQTNPPIKCRVPWYRRNSVHPILGGSYWAHLCNSVHTGGSRMTLGTGKRWNGKKGRGGGRKDRRKDRRKEDGGSKKRREGGREGGKEGGRERGREGLR